MSQSDYPAGVAFYVRTSMDSRSMFTALRRKVQELDAGMPVYGLKTLERQLDETLSTERLIAVLSAAFGLLATVLAALGLYGVMAFMVARRTKEIGLRMALGAPQVQVIWMVMRETLVLVAAGLAIGIPAALGCKQIRVHPVVRRQAYRYRFGGRGAGHFGAGGGGRRFPAGAARQHNRPDSSTAI